MKNFVGPVKFLLIQQNIFLGAFLDEIFKTEFLMTLKIFMSPKCENQDFNDCYPEQRNNFDCVCYLDDLKRNDNRKSSFAILSLDHLKMITESFYGDQIIDLCTETHK